MNNDSLLDRDILYWTIADVRRVVETVSLHAATHVSKLRIVQGDKFA